MVVHGRSGDDRGMCAARMLVRSVAGVSGGGDATLTTNPLDVGTTRIGLAARCRLGGGEAGAAERTHHKRHGHLRVGSIGKVGQLETALVA